MPYYVGGVIQSATYNYFVDIMNSIYGDRNINATVPFLANTGYGILPNIGYVNPITPATSPNDIISAAQWNSLFSAINACGVHQGYDTSPIPTSPIQPGDLVTAFNHYLTTRTLKDVISNIVANKNNIATSQITIVPAAPAINSVSWTTGKQYTFSVDFGSWNNARYFFNSGGKIAIAGSYTGGSQPTSDLFWNTFWTGMGTIRVGWQDSTASGGSQSSNNGFYDLTTSFQEVYRRVPINAGVAYSNSYIAINAQLAAPAGTNGVINFQVNTVDNDSTPAAKTGTNTINVAVYQSGGAIPYPGPAVVVTPGTFTNTFVAAPAGVLVAVSVLPNYASATIVDGGTAITGTLTATATGGVSPYTYVWSNTTATPNIVTSFSNPTPPVSAGSVTTTLSRLLSAGEIASGTVQVLVTDSASHTVVTYVNWSTNSNLSNP